jgi:hypothetical protein
MNKCCFMFFNLIIALASSALARDDRHVVHSMINASLIGEGATDLARAFGDGPIREEDNPVQRAGDRLTVSCDGVGYRYGLIKDVGELTHIRSVHRSARPPLGVPFDRSACEASAFRVLRALWGEKGRFVEFETVRANLTGYDNDRGWEFGIVVKFGGCKIGGLFDTHYTIKINPYLGILSSFSCENYGMRDLDYRPENIQQLITDANCQEIAERAFAAQTTYGLAQAMKGERQVMVLKPGPHPNLTPWHRETAAKQQPIVCYQAGFLNPLASDAHDWITVYVCMRTGRIVGGGRNLFPKAAGRTSGPSREPLSPRTDGVWSFKGASGTLRPADPGSVQANHLFRALLVRDSLRAIADYDPEGGLVWIAGTPYIADRPLAQGLAREARASGQRGPGLP